MSHRSLIYSDLCPDARHLEQVFAQLHRVVAAGVEPLTHERVTLLANERSAGILGRLNAIVASRRTYPAVLPQAE